ncbi:glycoside hydrolase family 127 protein [Cohnella suwonensis]|uniref:Glycoside hydrolase family 127 protein n=1 Tax=Cohnella suwonensis TaxID=696072 RepID=A0ABW0M1F4_9BACL
MNVRITDKFWLPRIEQTVRQGIAYQWKALNDEIIGAEPSHAVENFRIAAGESDGKFHGMVFQDSDVAKWIEAASFGLREFPDAGLESAIDSVIALIGRAQQPDGYLNTYYTVAAPDGRWTDFAFGHELYCAGHLIEAAVAYYEATGKASLLDIMSKYADHIDRAMGPNSERTNLYCGHEEIELALVKLYRVTNEERFLALSRHFVEERGKQPSFLREDPGFGNGHKDRWFDLDYHQAHAPVREQEKAEGHAVRAVYLYSAMADLALLTDDATLTKALQKLWRHVTTKRMYITGGIGSQGHAERFTVDYDLPNDTAYTETCASIGLMMWAFRMLRLEQDSRYADVMERVLYNGAISGISLDGTRYFYVNPLEVHPDVAKYRYDMQHVKTERVPWFGCACCPPNIARLLASLQDYVFNQTESEIAMHLYAANEAKFLVKGRTATLRTETDYPWNGLIHVRIGLEQATEHTLSFRIPSWCREPRISVNGEDVRLDQVAERGYARLSRMWADGDVVILHWPMTVERMEADPRVHENAGRVALQFGPMIYCLEEADNGGHLTDIRLNPDANLTAEFRADVLGGAVVISGDAERADLTEWQDELYVPVRRKTVRTRVQAVPYAFWNNRAPGEMLVWIRES